ncbi:DUF6571 family protein [Actinoplanes derwentensis]|uniref:Uncharacterized protein n=1 Tax=Actinoplanes derwentensis TaxID=113562 RepID=A0A1H1SSV7_9ACTN|nr:DUF6571 family protein [Actinoplanes derwentensis]GID83219.1 hypothetical protein Ade03nite_21430 [Actinoplanes derwentensis]SDS51015.1 hypothetical protein SAMN04489716_0942 [Actinoplanes derwentensis]
MSEMTLQLLLAFDAAPWHAAAERWRQLERGIDDATDQVIRGTRDFSFAWPSGAGSAATLQEAAAVSAAVGNAYGPARRIREAMDQHAYAMGSLRQQAESIVAAAQQGGYTVDTAAGTITAPASAYMGGNLDRTGRETGMLLNDLRSVVEYARAQDDATAGIINENVPSAQSGFGASPPGAIVRATELARKIKDPAYQPTAAEFDELLDLIQTYGRDQVFAFDLLTALGPKGLLELSGTLATYQLDYPGKDADNALFNNNTADLVRDLQNGLGVMLGTATTETGATTGLRGETYVPGQHELSSQWVTDLMAAGRSRMDIGDPSSPMRYVEDVYGYQLLGPLLHSGGFDSGFLSTIGGDIVDFEIEQGKGSDLWGEARGENVRLDWTQGHDDNKTPAGYDPMNGLMDALSRNGEAGRDLLTGVSEYTSVTDAQGERHAIERLPRLDYLLTDREWNPTADTPGGPGWTAEVLGHGDDYKSSALDDFGTALERATIGQPGEDSRRLVEAIIFETNVDEEAEGLANGENNGDTKTFAETDLIKPQLRDSIGTIMSAYIVDVNENIAAGQPTGSESFRVDQTHMLRFLADLGKDQGAHGTITAAEAVYAAGTYDNILAGRLNPDADIHANVDAMQVISHRHGSVLGAVDFGAALEQHATSAESDDKHNTSVEDRYKIAGPLAEMVVGAATSRVPGASDLINGFAGNVLSDLEESGKIDSSGRVTYEVGAMLGGSRAAAVAGTEAALLYSGRLEGLPDSLFDRGGHLKPMEEWAEEEIVDWREYKGDRGLDTVGKAATEAAESYQGGYAWAQGLTTEAANGGSK